MAGLASEYLQRGPSEELWRFLQFSFDELVRHHGAVIGRRVAIPKLIRLPQQRSA